MRRHTLQTPPDTGSNRTPQRSHSAATVDSLSSLMFAISSGAAAGAGGPRRFAGRSTVDRPSLRRILAQPREKRGRTGAVGKCAKDAKSLVGADAQPRAQGVGIDSDAFEL